MMGTFRVVENLGEAQVRICLPQKGANAQQLLPVIRNFGDPQSRNQWVVVSLPSDGEDHGPVKVTSWEPVYWEEAEPKLADNLGSIDIYILTPPVE